MPSDPDRALSEIKDSAVILSMAGEYLCEEVFLRKIRAAVEKNVELLRHQVEVFKREFVGIPLQEMSLDEELENIARFATLLEGPEAALEEKCREGELGRTLWEKTKALARVLDDLKAKVEGRPIEYEKRDYFFDLKGRFKSIYRKIAGTYPFFFKLMFITVGACVVVFSYFYLTMERETDLLKKIDQSQASVVSKKETLSRLGEQIQRTREKAESFSQGLELTRQEKIEAMYWTLKTHELVEQRDRVQLELDSEEQALKENVRKIDEMKRKPFLSRLFRP